jgi:sialate O-acetylesterase
MEHLSAKIKSPKRALLLVACTICYSSLFATVRLPRLISDGMVLQRNTDLKIWGWAESGEQVTIHFLNKTYTTRAGIDRGWEIPLKPMPAGGPYEMKIVGLNEIHLHNILIGDVWLCSGQSNMELDMTRLRYRYPKEIASAENPNIRQFLVPDRYDFNSPHPDFENGSWQSANPQTVLNFTGVGYFFAKVLYDRYKVPIGIINAALGGSPAQAWISESALKKFPAYYDEMQRYKSEQLITQTEERERKAIGKWYQELNTKDAGERGNWKEGPPDLNGWEQITIPGYWTGISLPSHSGVIWLAKEITLNKKMLNQPAKLELGRIVDADSVFINEHFAGQTSYQYPPRRYELKPGMLKEGKNLIVVRVISNTGKGGFVPGKPYELTTATDTVKLEGSWRWKSGAVMPPAPGQSFIRWKPGGLYNAMIAPLTQFAIKGVAWYQGESNVSNASEYGDLMRSLIRDWRNQWHYSNLPFLIIQLPNYLEPKAEPGESQWATLRQQQLNLLSLPATGLVVTIDLGEWNDIHPENKKEVGRRLALQAEQIAYHEKNETASGPLFKSMRIEKNKIVLSFSGTDGGLVAKGDGTLHQFAICGKNRKFVWARARIRNNTVEVWSDQIKDPVAVRYAWADNPKDANFYNRIGLPASPFTTEVQEK